MGLMVGQADRLRQALEADIAEQHWYENCRCVVETRALRKGGHGVVAYVIFDNANDPEGEKKQTSKEARVWLKDSFEKHASSYYDAKMSDGFAAVSVTESYYDSYKQLAEPGTAASMPANVSNSIKSGGVSYK